MIDNEVAKRITIIPYFGYASARQKVQVEQFQLLQNLLQTY